MIVISQCFELIGKGCLFWVIIKYTTIQCTCNYGTNEDIHVQYVHGNIYNYPIIQKCINIITV